MRHLIEVAGPQLTSEDPQCRRNSMTLLGLVLTRCPALKTPADVVESLVAFCSGRLFDWYSVEGAMLVYSGLLEHHLEVVRWGSVEMDYYDVIPHDDENCDPQYGSQKTRRLERFTCARVIFESILKRVHAPGFSQSIRGTILKVLSCILTEFSEDVRDAGPRIVTGICCQVENEKDPRNLMLSFPLMKTLLSDFDDLIREDLQHCDLISDVLLAYFPIRFKPPPNDPFGVTESDLCGQLRECLVVNKRLGSHALNVILDVLNDGLAANNEFDVIESVETLKFCFQHFEVATLIAHAQPLLEVIKLAAWQSPCQYLPILAESLSALIAAGISKSEGSTVTLHEISGCIRRLLQQCVEHMAKPQMLPGSCGLISSRLVFLEIVKLNSDAAGTGWEVVMHVLSPFSSVKNMLATLSNSVQSDLTRGTETQQLDSPTASWERVAMDLDFLQKLVEAQETLEAASEATVSLLDILATYSGCILRHKPTAGSSLMTSIARCSLLSVGPSSISEASSSVGSIGCMVSTFAYILGLPRENDSTVQNWVEEWRTYVTQSMRVNGQSLLVDKSSSVSILLQTISLMVEKSLIARTVAFPLLRQYFQNVILDQSSVVKFTNEEKTRAEVVSQIAYKCISAAALNRDPCDSASKLVTLLFSIAVSEVSVVHPQHMIGNSLWVLETVLRCLWSAIRPVISDSETRPYCSIIIGEFINGMDAFFLKRNGPAVILLQSVTESQSEGVLKSFRLLLSSSITLVDDISKLANYLEVSMSILETQQSTGALLLIPCILPRVLALCEETEPVEQLLGRLQTICFSVACPVQGLLSRSVDEVDAARSILASLVFRGPEGCTATVLASMRARWQAACSGSGQPISERVDVSITQGWILRALWTRQFSQRSIPQISAFNEILELIQAGVECDSELQFLAPETFSVVVGPLQSAAVGKTHCTPITSSSFRLRLLMLRFFRRASQPCQDQRFCD